MALYSKDITGFSGQWGHADHRLETEWWLRGRSPLKSVGCRKQSSQMRNHMKKCIWSILHDRVAGGGNWCLWILISKQRCGCWGLGGGCSNQAPSSREARPSAVSLCKEQFTQSDAQCWFNIMEYHRNQWIVVFRNLDCFSEKLKGILSN